MLNAGIAWADLSAEYGDGPGVACWRRLREWRAIPVLSAKGDSVQGGAVIARQRTFLVKQVLRTLPTPRVNRTGDGLPEPVIERPSTV